MATPLIIPVLLLDGSLQNTVVSADTTAEGLITSLAQLDEVKHTVVLDVAPSDWALQHTRKEKPGRLWDHTKLVALGDGILPSTSLVAPFLNVSDSDLDPSPLATLRLVARHPLHSLLLTLLRIPEIEDGFEWMVFFGKENTVDDVVNGVVRELGLLKVLPRSRGGGQIEYVLEVPEGSEDQGSTQLLGSARMTDILSASTRPTRVQFCIPDQWFRRKAPAIQSRQSTAYDASDSYSELSDKSSADEEGEGEGTAKQSKSGSVSRTTFQIIPSPEWRGSVAQNRLTSLLSGWSQSPPAPAPASTTTSTSAVIATSAGNRKSVSEPLLIQQNTDGSASTNESIGSSDFDSEEFERCMDILGVKRDARANMHSMSPDKKRQFIEQVRGQFSKTGGAATSLTYGPSSGSALLPRLVPQLSGDTSFFKRISTFPTWGSTTSPPAPVVSPRGRSSGDFATGSKSSLSSEIVEEAAVQSQTTGSMFSTWWTALGGEMTPENEHSTSARAYVDGMRKSRNMDSKLAKHLISLRVHLSTAKLPWIETFITEEGIIAISGLFSSLVGKGGKRKALSDSETSVLLELIRSLRVLLNTEPGFDAVLLSPTIVTHIAYSLHGTSLKIRTLAAELLAAICMVSFDEGHRAVLAALSEYRIAYNELFRFQSLVAALKIPDSLDEMAISEETFSTEEEGIWEARTAFMALINAVTNCPHTLEERIVLRDEFSRRGLNEVVAALRYIKPPDLLLKQLDMYTEEKYEDEEDFRERARRAVRDSRKQLVEASDPSNVFDEIMQAAQILDVRGMVERILYKFNIIFQSASEPSYKSGTLSVMDEFLGGITTIDGSEQAWTSFLQSLVTSVQQLSGRELPIGNTESLEREAQNLRRQVKDLTRENAALKTDDSRHRKDGSGIYVGAEPTAPAVSLPSPSKSKVNPGSKAGNEMISGLMQRLMQKEKEATRLSGELDRLKIQLSSDMHESDDRARKERDKAKLNSLSDEITGLKEKIAEMDNALSVKSKEMAHVRGAIEAMYTHLQPKADKESELDTRTLIGRILDKLSERDEVVVSLRSEVQALQQAMAERTKEQKFKANNPPPPPPLLSDRRKATVSKAHKVESTTGGVDISDDVSPPPPPPPPPLLSRLLAKPSPDLLSSDVLSLSPLSAEGSPPSPPPPPPPPPPPLPLSIIADDVPPPPPLPPLPGGVVPPPPPPPGPVFHSRSRPKQSGPRLKPFFWNKLDGNSIGSTIWSEPSLIAEFKMDDLEATFTIDATPQTPSRIASSSGKQHVTTLLETTRANNMAIMLSRFKISYSAIRQALLELDGATLSIDDLKAISKQLPTTEEMTRIKDFGDVTKLAKADQFIHEIMNIPRLSQRLECMIFCQRFELDVEEIRPDLKTVRDACRELRTSKLFKKVLQAVLAVGNRLNSSSFRGSARGFRLEALLKMKETKTAKASADCPTLLHYVALVLLRTEPKSTLFIEELPNLEPAARISFQTVSQAVQSAIASRAKVEAEIQLMGQLRQSFANDQFVTVMQKFVVQATGSVEALREMTASVENDLRSLFSYYGESYDSSDSLKSEDFFGMICSFSSWLQKAAIDIEPRARTALPRSDNKQEAVKGPGSTPKDLLAPPPRHERQRSFGRGNLDEALRTLKDGQTWRQRSTPSSVRVPLNKVFVDGRTDGQG